MRLGLMYIKSENNYETSSSSSSTSCSSNAKQPDIWLSLMLLELFDLRSELHHFHQFLFCHQQAISAQESHDKQHSLQIYKNDLVYLAST